METIPEEVQLTDDASKETPEKRGLIIKAIGLENMEFPKKIIVKVDLNGKCLGKSEEFFVQDQIIELNWDVFYEIIEETEDYLDQLITHPLIFTVLCESITPIEDESAVSKKGDKGKKDKGKDTKSASEKGKSIKELSISNDSKKTSKSAMSKSSTSNAEVYPVLGVANVDVMPLLLGQGDIEEMLFVHPTIEKKGSQSIAWANLPVLKVSITLTENVINEISGSITNVLSVTLESLHNISPDCNEDITVATIMPNDEIVKFKNGTLLLDDLTWISRKKKWHGLRDLPGQGALSQYKGSDKILDLLNTMDYEITSKSLVKKPMIFWNQFYRTLLDIDSENILKEKNLEYSCWPVEIIIPSSPIKSGKQRVSNTKFNHYITFLDLSRLMYPGETTVRVTSQLYTYIPEAMKTRFGSVQILFDENTPPNDQEVKPKTASSKKEAKPESSVKSKKDSLKSKDVKKVKKEKLEEVNETESIETKESEPVFNDEGEPIFIVVEVGLLNPLVPKREQEKILESIHKIVPKRERLTPQQMEKINATKLYEDCIKTLIHIIHDEYQIFFNVNETYKNSCKNFLLHLHVTGTYAKMVETMREAITALVKESVGPAETWGKMKYNNQDILTNLYQDMANKMYAIVQSVSDPSMKRYEPEITCENLQYFECEALEEGDYNKAHYYLLQRLEKSEKADPQVWIDFAKFWKRKLEFEKAEECAKEAISLNPRHTNALLFHGLLSWLMEDFEVAEMFLSAVVTFNPSCLEGWVTLHMLHKQMGKLKEANVELLHAKDCISEFFPAIEGKSNSLMYWCAGMAELDRIFLLTAAVILSLSFPEFAELALSYDLLLHGKTLSYLYYLAVCHYQQGRHTNSITHLEEALKLHWEDDRVWALKGHNFYKLEKPKEAAEAYHVALNFKDQEDQHLIHLRLGHILMQEGDHKGARECYTIICRDSPTPLSWLGLGVSAFVDDDLEAAELALSEANILDCKMGRVWGYLALVNLMMDRPLIFNRCIMHAFKYGFEDSDLMERIDKLVKLVQPTSN